MVRPLYRIHDDRQPRLQQGHAGLWFDKFCDKWQPEWTMELLKDGASDPPKFEWIKDTAGQVGNGALVRESACRLMRLAWLLRGSTKVYETEFRFVTGLGRNHPVENGFAWHPTLGTPFLPGSSVKGMIGAWAKAEHDNQEDRKRILGSHGQVGSVRFLDAVPMDVVSLEADVMTPHYAGWSPQKPPGDWCSPKPIPFLTTAPGTRFVFGIVPTLSTQADDLDIVSGWLDQALKWAGAGAKTAVGYGRMKRDRQYEATVMRKIEEEANKKREERKREEQLAAMSPITREIHEILGARQDKKMLESTAVFNEIRDGRWEGDDKIAAAEWLKDKLQSENRWKESSKKKRPERDKDYQRTRRIKKWLDAR